MKKENRGEECKMEVSSASKPDVTFTPLSSKLCNENDGKNEKEIVKIPSSYCSGKEESGMKKPPSKDVAPTAIVTFARTIYNQNLQSLKPPKTTSWTKRDGFMTQKSMLAKSF